MAEILGLDIGGTGIKAAIVDSEKGMFVGDRMKYATPQPSTPDNIFTVIEQLIDDFDWHGKIVGCGFPSIIKNDVIFSAANIDKSWKGVNLAEMFRVKLKIKAHCVNDADAAGIAEVMFGKGKNKKGTVLMLTLGTGIGSGLFKDGILVPNTELGHLYYKDSIWEKYASNSAREKRQLSWQEWGGILNHYINHVDLLLNPDLIILGGGVSKRYRYYSTYLDLRKKITPAKMQNDAGIIGAALCAYDLIK